MARDSRGRCPWFRGIFAQANRRLSETLLNVPSIRETTLDDAFILAVTPHTAPKLLPSGAVVRIDVHNIGGLRRVSRWEVGDIGIAVFVIRRKRILARKIGILQAKRLYPANEQVDDEDAVGFQYGMNAFLRPDESPSSMALSRSFRFDQNCRYGALQAGSDQQSVIDDFEKRFAGSVYYLFYNPPSVPARITYPVTAYRKLRGNPKLGARVTPVAPVHELLAARASGQSVTLAEINGIGPTKLWRLETWAADLLLTCREGRPYTPADEDLVERMIIRRTGPIGAAIMISVELPSD